ncbi:hypothetical protein SAMN02745945_02399 [Peptoclostridium litorale DSM 5388]|uniref:Uncharacterized protein n=1 Tax=Peptoclostridium litorale DSM 5388 TaxID=1121324 RepID=A0A069RHP5_PEPLI|nr:hypothetical protein [Peptoclostridium litorale]KDR96318.1 hypothetical protein CLIT_4c01550 [Peptoclostridium litorale DSM 5388]SIO26280.1 hypothetical protein SAMN02745945_02399 [Peptoclostridium litorale DSM 5388]
MDFKKMAQGLMGHKKDLDTSGIDLSSLITDSFISEHSSFSTVLEFLKASGFGVDSMEGLSGIPVEKLNEYISKVTDFNDWPQMLKTAMSMLQK